MQPLDRTLTDATSRIGSERSITRRVSQAATLGFLVALATLPYANTFRAGFTFDDYAVIQANRTVQGPIDPMTFLLSRYPPGLYRPLTELSFALNRVTTVAGYHVVNVVLHVLVTLLVFVLALRTFESRRLALVAAALFAVHPIHTEAVTSVVGRGELLAALFGLLALLWAPAVGLSVPQSRRRLRETASLACFGLAMLSKESALTILPLIVAQRVYQRNTGIMRALRAELDELQWAPYLACALAYLWLRSAVLGPTPAYFVTPLDNVFTVLSPAARVRSAIAVLWDYFGLLNFPLVLSADYSYNQVPVAPSWFDPRAVAGCLMLAAAVLIVVRHRDRRVCFAVVFPLIAISLTANLLFAIGTVKAERLLYLPSVGWVLLAAYGIESLWRLPAYRHVAVLILLVATTAFAMRAWERNEDWRDNLALYASMVRTAPQSAKAHYNLGVALQVRGARTQAVRQYEAALAIYPFAEAAIGLGDASESDGSSDEAIRWYQRALEIIPPLSRAHVALCEVLVDTRRFAQAEQACRAGLRYDPANPVLLRALAQSFAGTGAVEAADELVRSSPTLAASRRSAKAVTVARSEGSLE